jgi:hypothetical protein
MPEPTVSRFLILHCHEFAVGEKWKADFRDGFLLVFAP